MVLHNVNLLKDGIKSIKIIDEKIVEISSNDIYMHSPDSLHIHFENSLAFPGLINSHDHLDFNLFPQLGNCIYKNYIEWGRDIHQQDKIIIDSVLKIPKALRTQWGVYKNLLGGVTTIVQHGERLTVNEQLIDIFTHSRSLHSVRLEKHWKRRLNKPFTPNLPVVIHTGEGTDNDAYEEINELIRWNILKRKLIGIHGIAMDVAQAKHFEALIWCPDSNFFLFGATAAIDKLKSATKILLGTDSNISANWNIWHHLRVARETALLTDDELINSVTTVPANVWKLNHTGMLKEQYDADIVVAKNKNGTGDPVECFFELNPEDLLLVLSKGDIVLFDESLQDQLAGIPIENYNRIWINNANKYVKGNILELVKIIKTFNPEAVFPIEIE